MRKKFPELEEFLRGENFWADGYFAESVGVAQEEMIRKHIREQRDDDQSRPTEVLGLKALLSFGRLWARACACS